MTKPTEDVESLIKPGTALSQLSTNTARSRVAAIRRNEQQPLEQAEQVESSLGTSQALIKAVDARDIARLRARAYNVVAEQTERAQEVLEGKRAWTNQQVRLYGMLLNKVLPDLKHTFQEVHANKPEGMSREDLERIVAEAHAAERQAQQEDDD